MADLNLIDRKNHPRDEFRIFAWSDLLLIDGYRYGSLDQSDEALTRIQKLLSLGASGVEHHFSERETRKRRSLSKIAIMCAKNAHQVIQ